MTDRTLDATISPVPNGLVLVIDGGVHQGARIVLPASPARVGPGLDNDIVVSDLPGGTSFRLEREAGALLLQAEDAGLSLPGEVALAPGQSQSVRGDVAFTCGDVPFRLVGPRPIAFQEAPSRRLALTPARRTALAAVLTISLITLMPGLDGAPASGLRLSRNALPSALVTSASAASSPDATGAIPGNPPKRPMTAATPAPAASTPAQLMTLLRQHLVASGLDAVSLLSQPDGSVEARGQVPPQREAAWRDVSRWFDGASGGRLVLVDQVRFAAEAPPLALQAVWPGRHPYVIDGDGDKLFVGTVLSSGWTISSISADRVVVKRGDQLQAVRF